MKTKKLIEKLELLEIKSETNRELINHLDYYYKKLKSDMCDIIGFFKDSAYKIKICPVDIPSDVPFPEANQKKFYFEIKYIWNGEVKSVGACSEKIKSLKEVEIVSQSQTNALIKFGGESFLLEKSKGMLFPLPIEDMLNTDNLIHEKPLNSVDDANIKDTLDKIDTATTNDVSNDTFDYWTETPVK